MTVTLIVSLVVAVSVGRLADCLTNDKDDRRAHMSHYAYGSKYPYAINHQLRLPPPHHYHHQHHDFKPVRGPSFALTTLLPIMTTSTTTTTPAAPTGQSVPMVSVNCNRNSNQANDGQTEPDIGDEFAAAYYLDRAKESLNYYQERVMQELDGLRERDRELNEKLSRVSHVVAANDRDLGTCRAALASLENTVAQQVREVNGCRTSLASSETANKMAASELTSCKASVTAADGKTVAVDHELSTCRTALGALEMTVNEFYNRERDIESRVALMEEESGKLREKLRAHFRVEIKRADRRVSATASNRSKALLTFRNVTVAMFNSIRVTMAQDDGKLSIEETVKKLNVPVGRGFDHLKVVKTNGTSRLSLCNQRGNQFFEHKKYDSFYSNLSDDVKSFNPNMITSDNPINWLDINGRCGFWSCFQLKATEDPSSPLVINSRDKQPIGHMSPVVAYFEHASFVLNNGREDVRFTSPYLDKLQGEFFVIDSTTPSKRLQVDLNVFDVIDKESFTTMIETAFP